MKVLLKFGPFTRPKSAFRSFYMTCSVLLQTMKVTFQPRELTADKGGAAAAAQLLAPTLAALQVRSGGNPGVNGWSLLSTPIQMPPRSGDNCGRLTSDLPSTRLQGGERLVCIALRVEAQALNPKPLNRRGCRRKQRASVQRTRHTTDCLLVLIK